MPDINGANVALQRQFELAPGRYIYVDQANGSDSTGTGSSAAPYATFDRASQDLTSGNNDTIVIRGNYSASTQTRIASIDNFRILGIGTNWTNTNLILNNITGSAVGNVPTGDTGFSTRSMRVTTSVAHGLSVNDWVGFKAGVAADANLRLNSIGRITAATATTMDVDIPGGTLSTTYPNTTEPQWFQATLVLQGCENVIIQGITFEGSNVIAAGGNCLVANDCRNVFIYGCTFDKCTLALTGQSLLISTGPINNTVEGCVFIPQLSYGATFTGISAHNGWYPIYLHQGYNPVFVGNQVLSFCLNSFVASDFFVSGRSSEGFINMVGAPLLGVQWFDNVHYDTINAGSTYDKMVTFQVSGAETSFFPRGNFFQGQVTGAPVEMDDDTGRTDQEPATIPSQSYIKTWGELIWRRRIQDAQEVAGSMGEAVARVAYDGAIHIDVANGTSGQVAGINGTINNPVNNIGDAVVLAAALGLSKYLLRGEITLTTAHPDWEFEGFEPQRDIINLGGQNVAGSSFQKVNLRGAQNGTVSCAQCVIGQTATTYSGWQGVFNDCSVQGTAQPASGQSVRSLHIASEELNGTNVDFTGAAAGTTILAADADGFWNIQNATNAGHIVAMDLDGGDITLESSVTAGIFVFRGLGEVTDSSTSTTSYDDTGLVRGSLLDVAVSSRAAPGAAMDLITDAVDADALAASALTEIETAVGNALDAQGLTSVRAALLDNLDAAITTRAAAANVDRLFGDNTRTQLSTADAEISGGGRFVPADAVSHMRVQTKAEAASDFSAPVEDYYVVFSYATGAVSTDAPASSERQLTAPVDGIFTTTPFPT